MEKQARRIKDESEPSIFSHVFNYKIQVKLFGIWHTIKEYQVIDTNILSGGYMQFCNGKCTYHPVKNFRL